jgi:hypothetical protein
MLIYNPPYGKSIRVPKIFDSCSKEKIRVHLCNLWENKKYPWDSRLLPFGQWVFDKSRVQRKIRVHLCVPKTSIDLIHAYIYFMSFLRLLKC